MYKGYRMWDWKYHLDNGRLLYLFRDKMDIYTPLNLAGTWNTANR
jgi:hypothetical protein